MATGSAFVTGGSGFVGRNLVQHLIDLGNTTVTAIYRSDAAKQTIEGLVTGEAVSKVKLVQAELSQVDALQKGMEVSCRERGCRCSLLWLCALHLHPCENPVMPFQAVQGCEVVYHCAAKAEMSGPMRDFERDNVEGTKNVLRAAKAAGVKR